MTKIHTNFKYNQQSREKDTTYIVDCSLGSSTCQQGINGNACLHQVAVALKYGISNLNFIPQTAKERFNIAILAARNNTKFNVSQFVSLDLKEIESDSHFFGNQKVIEEPQAKIPMSTSMNSPDRGTGQP